MPFAVPGLSVLVPITFGLLTPQLVLAQAGAPVSPPAATTPTIIVRGEVGQRAVPMRAFDAEVRSALLAAQPGPGVAGAALDVTLKTHAVPIEASAPGELACFTRGGADLTPALKELVDQMSLRHRGWFAGKRIELTIAEPAAPADLASCTLALAVGIDAMLVGWTVDPAFAALGTVKAHGDIGAVSHPIPRLLATFRAGSQRVVVPDKMWAQVSDLLVAEGVASFSKSQMFTANSLDEVMAIASDPPSAQVERATARFRVVQRALQTPGIDADAELVRPALKDALREVLTITPNHLSARLLLGRTTGQYKNLSVPGSLAAIEAMGATLLKAARSSAPTDLTQLPAAPVQAEVARLKAAKVRLDPKAHPVVDAILVYADVVRAWYERPAESTGNRGEQNRVLYAAAKQIRDEVARLTPSP